LQRLKGYFSGRKGKGGEAKLKIEIMKKKFCGKRKKKPDFVSFSPLKFIDTVIF
jgi:hypothetical protein